MTKMGYKTKAEMKVIVRNYNCKKEEQEEKWETLTSFERGKFLGSNRQSSNYEVIGEKDTW